MARRTNRRLTQNEAIEQILRLVDKLDDEHLELLFEKLEPLAEELDAQDDEDRALAQSRQDESTVPYRR